MKTFKLFQNSASRALIVLGVALLPCVAFLAKAAEGEPKAAGAAAPRKTPYEKRWEERVFVMQSTSCYNCHETLPRQNGRPAREHVTSAHWRAAVTCNECHGGDPTKDTPEEAHDEAKGWIGKLDHDKMLERCGTCHKTEVETFKKSKHFPEHEGVKRLSCLECHGAHDIGARTTLFNWTGVCLQCHVNPPVPKLPEELLQMMASKDAMHSQLRQLRYKLENRRFPLEIMEPYREVRQLSADVVHATKAEGISDVMKEIMEKNKALGTLISAETKNKP